MVPDQQLPGSPALTSPALALAARVVADPGEMPLAISELLEARIVNDRLRVADRDRDAEEQATTLRVPSPWHGLFVFSRPDEPFTPAESARAQRLAEIAEIAAASSYRARHVSRALR